MSTIDTSYHNGARYSVIRQPQGFVVIDKQDHNHWVYGPVQSVKTARDWCVKLNRFDDWYYSSPSDTLYSARFE